MDRALNDEAFGADGNQDSALRQLENSIRSMKRPAGTKKNPVRSCQDLALANAAAGEQSVSGNYWVDPNSGCDKDAIEVFCDFSAAETWTCVSPSNAVVDGRTHITANPAHTYMANMAGGSQISYEPTDALAGVNYESQITFLRLLASKARQQITYNCKNSVAVQNGATGAYTEALKILGANGVEFTAEGAEQYNVLEDGCANSSGNWDQTIIEVATTKTARLPVVDVAPYDIGTDNKQFGLEVGAVCFA